MSVTIVEAAASVLAEYGMVPSLVTVREVFDGPAQSAEQRSPGELRASICSMP